MKAIQKSKVTTILKKMELKKAVELDGILIEVWRSLEMIVRMESAYWDTNEITRGTIKIE